MTDRYLTLVLDSMFLSSELTRRLSNNPSDDKLMRITGKSWERHWRRVQIARKNGYPELKIPNDVIIGE